MANGKPGRPRKDALAEAVSGSIAERHQGDKQELAFEDIKTYDWEIRPVLRKETEHVTNPRTGKKLETTEISKVCPAIDIKLERMETDRATGAPSRVPYQKILMLPFFTFDNWFVNSGLFTPEDVAKAIWDHEGFKKHYVEIVAVTEAERSEYMRERDSVDVQQTKAKLMSFSPEQYRALAKVNDDLINGVESESIIPGVPFAVPA